MAFMIIALAVCIVVCIYLYYNYKLNRYVKMLNTSMGQTEQAIKYLRKSMDLNVEQNNTIEKLNDKLTAAEAAKKDDVSILYECDRNACAICKNIECHMTGNIDHAVNFDKVDDGLYVERCRRFTMADVTRTLKIEH